MSLDEYHKFFKDEAKKLKTDYDGVVAYHIDIIE
jgi:hypothetical protein